MTEKPKIIDEMCRCGHLISEHLPQPIGYALAVKGHGRCKVCDCKKFTWVSFVMEK